MTLNIVFRHVRINIPLKKKKKTWLAVLLCRSKDSACTSHLKRKRGGKKTATIHQLKPRASGRCHSSSLSSVSLLAMSHPFLRQLAAHCPVLLPTAAWTLLLTLTVSIASLAPAAAFMAAIISPSSSLSRKTLGCSGSSNADRHCLSPCGSFIGIPLGVPGEILCVPERMVAVSDFDFLLPTVFAAVAVLGSACLLRSLGLWEEITVDGRVWFLVGFVWSYSCLWCVFFLC